MAAYQKVCKTKDVPKQGGISFQVGEKLIAVFQIDGEYFAMDDTCPHMGASLAAGELQDGIVTCPWHAWRFRVCDGTWCDNPRISIGSYPVRVDGDEIQLALETKQ